MKKLLIIDENGFARVCSAILKNKGHEVENISISDFDELSTKLTNNEYGLIVTSYPYCAVILETIKKKNVPALILSDHIDNSLFSVLKNLDNSFCMLKPLDYDRFRSLVTQIINGKSVTYGGYCIV